MSTMDRAMRRIREHSPFEFFFGWLLARKFTSAGLTIVRPGFPKPEVVNRGGMIVAGNCAFFPGVRLEVLPGGRITIGTGTYLNRRTEIVAGRDITIGRNCRIAWDVVIMDTDQHDVDGADRSAPVRIDDDVWIGCRAIVLKGVHIGRGAVIGAGAIVTHDVPAGGRVAGTAASPIGRGRMSANARAGLHELTTSDSVTTNGGSHRPAPGAAGGRGERTQCGA